MSVILTSEALAEVELRIKNAKNALLRKQQQQRQALANRTNIVCTPKIKKFSWKKQLRKRFSSKFVAALDTKSSNRNNKVGENLMKKSNERNDPLQSEL